MHRLARADRRLGGALRSAAAARPGVRSVATLAARGLGPAFRIGVAAAVANPRTRRAGVEAAIAAECAARLAALLRTRIGRERPGPRDDAGFPSRHASASAAIATVACLHAPAAGAVVAALAVAGSGARVLAGDHEPADIAAGAALGVAVGAAVAGAVGRLAPGPAATGR